MSPVVQRPDHAIARPFLWFYKFGSHAFRTWPPVKQPIIGDAGIRSYTGLYSNADLLVPPAFAKEGFAGELIEVKGFSHTDFLRPRKFGVILASQLSRLTQS